MIQAMFFSYILWWYDTKPLMGGDRAWFSYDEDMIFK